MAEAAWRQRFRATRCTLPEWARDRPDRLVYGSNAGGKSEIYAWDRAAGTHRQVTDRSEGTSLGHIDPGGTMVWWFDDEAGSEFGGWMRQPFVGGTTEPADASLPSGYPAGLAVGTDLAVIGLSNDAGVGFFLLRPGQRAQKIYAHREFAVVGGLSRDESLVSMEHSEQGDSRHRAIRIIDPQGRAVAELYDGPGLGLEAGSWSPRRGDNRLLILHGRTGHVRPAVWQPKGDQVIDVAVSLPGDLRPSWYPDARALLIEHDYRGRTELYRYHLETSDLSRVPSPAGLIVRACVRPDGEVWFDWTSAVEPPQIRSASGPVIGTGPSTAPAGTAFADLDVNGVHAFLAEPSGPRPHPTIFGIHGGPESFTGDEYLPRTQSWVDHGYAVVSVNYRGSSGYGKAWRDALEGNPGFTELEDIVAVRERVVSVGIADPRRIIIWGGSWGGYLTLLGLGTRPELWSLGIAIAPVADYVAAYEDELEPERAYDRSLLGGTPGERPDFYRERSPITYVERVHVPVFIWPGATIRAARFARSKTMSPGCGSSASRSHTTRRAADISRS